MLQFSAMGTLALVALAMCWGLAVTVFRVSGPGSVARELSLLLVIEGATIRGKTLVECYQHNQKYLRTLFGAG